MGAGSILLEKLIIIFDAIEPTEPNTQIKVLCGDHQWKLL
jgi:hypothetical protein